MKYARIVVTLGKHSAPDLLTLLAGAPYVSETRLHDWNPSHDTVTGFFEVDGDIDRFRDAVETAPGTLSAEVTAISDGRFSLILVVDPSEVPFLRESFTAVTKPGLIIEKPVVYKDMKASMRVVGSAATLQAMMDSVPENVSMDITAVGDYHRSRDSPLSALSDRQREALLEAFERGYYEHPRQATHADIAACLGCKPHTVSEHLQKAEAKIIADALRDVF
ncbi:helix-turn-helix domain-containing protein [Haloferax sp. ATB1]|uniref:helix-turn-helix domain-containing protein n=1 Tax=Haloferax sp. ATB1 TaxID=1508454 RepID=UPI0005B215FD|nr:helix-turn-helix domain-containing protein [Haloferax sp. ATB1]